MDNERMRSASEQEVEATPETLRAYLDHLAESSRRFDSALTHYHALLKAQDAAEKELLTREQLFENEKRFTILRAKATKLAWATMRHLISSSIVGAGSGAAGYLVTGDPAITAIAAAGGAMLGSAAEFGLSHLENISDASERFLELYEPTMAYMRDKKRRERMKEGVVGREEEMTSLVLQLADLQKEITSIDAEIDEIGKSGKAMFKDPRAERKIGDSSRLEAEAAVQALSEHLRTAGQKFNELLTQYFEMTVVAESAEQYLAARQQAHSNRELIIQMRVTAQKAWEMLKDANLILGTAGVFAMGGYFWTAGKTGESNPPLAVLGASIGAAIGWFQISRLERNVWDRNIGGKLRDRLAVNEDYQLATDPELQTLKLERDQAQAEHTKLQVEQAKISQELETFMAKYPMKS